MSAIEVRSLTKHYGSRVAVDGIDLDVPAGTTVALLGPNGAGKTTTMEILEGFVPPTSGHVRVLGADPVRAGRTQRARIGVVLQATSLDHQLTVVEALTLFAGLYPQPMPVVEALELMDLGDQAGIRIGALSGGQQRRVDVALGIIGRPAVLFLDEPTTGLDPDARRRTWAGVGALAAGGTTIVLTTHQMEEAAAHADRVVVLADGRKVADATPAELRSLTGATTVRYPMPDQVPLADLPTALAAHVDAARRELVVRTGDVTAVLDVLVDWAHRHDVALTGLEVVAPSLEDTYLELTARA